MLLAQLRGEHNSALYYAKIDVNGLDEVIEETSGYKNIYLIGLSFYNMTVQHIILYHQQ